MNDYMQIFDGGIDGMVLPLVHGGSADAGGGLIGLVETLLAAITNLLESGSELVLFPGVNALATNVHPLFVHFPIAFLTAYFLLEIMGLVLRQPGLRQFAGGLLYLGAFGAVLAAAAGFVAASSVPHGGQVHVIMEWHERLMLTVSGLAVVLAVWRALAGVAVSAMAIGLHLFLAAAMMSLMFFGTDLGGLMVYRYGVGVASLQAQEDMRQHAHTSAAEAE